MKKPFVAKISVDVESAAVLKQEYRVLEHIHDTLGRSGNEFVIELIDWVANYDNNGNHIMFLERGATTDGDLDKIFKGQHLNALDDNHLINIAKNLLEIGSCLTKSGIVW